MTSDLISEVVKSVKRTPAVTVGRRITDTVKRVEKGTTVTATEDRDKLWAVQTPQAFQMKTLRAAFKALGEREVTDECQAVELSGESVKILEDLQIAGAILK